MILQNITQVTDFVRNGKATLFGKTGVIQAATTRYIHLMPRSEDDLDVSKIENLVIPD
ncbi:hypothetical protein GCM10027190_15850 [Spirosoma areae]